MKLNQIAVENFLNHFTEIAYLPPKQQKEIFLGLFDTDEKIDSFIRHDVLNMGLYKIGNETYTEQELNKIIDKTAKIKDEEIPLSIIIDIINGNEDIANLILKKYTE